MYGTCIEMIFRVCVIGSSFSVIHSTVHKFDKRSHISLTFLPHPVYHLRKYRCFVIDICRIFEISSGMCLCTYRCIDHERILCFLDS
jgi:hypothetical protein